MGYELYCSLLDQAVRRLKNVPQRDAVDVTIDLPISAYFPRQYVTDLRTKIDLYRRLARITDESELDDFAAEVAPDNGTLLVFKRSDNSWHGHHPFEGPRRSLQMNWMTSEGSRGWHKIRHTVSAAMKKLTAAQ